MADFHPDNLQIVAGQRLNGARLAVYDGTANGGDVDDVAIKQAKWWIGDKTATDMAVTTGDHSILDEGEVSNGLMVFVSRNDKKGSQVFISDNGDGTVALHLISNVA